MSKSSEKGAAVAEGEEEKLLEGVAVLDFNMLCATVAMQTQGKWRKLDEFEEIGGGFTSMWESGILDCFDDRRIALQSTCCSCPSHRFGKNMGQAGFNPSFVQGIMYILLAAAALANFTAFVISGKHYFLYLGLAFTISLATYMGYCCSQIRKRFNISYLEKPSQGSLTDSTSQMMDISRSLTTSAATPDWSQNLIGSGSNQLNYQSPMMQENMSSSRLNFRQELSSQNNQVQKDWSDSLSLEDGLEQISTTQSYSLNSTLPIMISSSYIYPSTIIENLSSNDNRPLNLPSTTKYHTNLNEIPRSLAKLPPLLTPLPNQQEISHLWNVSTSTPSDMSVSIFPSSQAPMVEKFNFPDLKTRSTNGAVQDSEKNNAEPALKGLRIETPSPLPTFKVRKEKLGDRITALHQLVSPFGKNDTASVLLEAIDYIKFLHGQVNALSTHKKNGAPIQQQQNNDNSNDPEGPNQDLRGRGLCLVPISTTFPIVNETTVEFWTPNFGGTFR